LNALGLLLAQSADEITTLKQPLWRDGSSMWLPPQASPTASAHDGIFNFIFWISVFFFFLIVGLMVYYVIRYRRRVEGEGPVVNPTHNTTLEIVWTAIPMVLVIVMFIWAFRSYIYNATPPSNAYQILVTGQKWNWLFEYPQNGAVSTTLAVPVDTPIELLMTSVDVTHSMYIPDFRQKKDVVPGRYSKLWFQAPEIGRHRIFCAEYCGTSHSTMISTVEVMSAGDFAAWLADAGNVFKEGASYADIGEQIYNGKGGCFQCHSVDGTAGTGPSWARKDGNKIRSIFGKQENVRINNKGPVQQVLVDENYIRESILEPNAKVTDGYDAVMNTYRGLLSDREITALIEYIKSLDEDYQSKIVPTESGDPNAAGSADDASESDSESTPAAETAEVNSTPQQEVS
jgi:cytochrome c oxidase subunit 2